MKHRVARSVGERGRAVFVGTFHAFCSSLLLERNPHLETLEKEDHWILLRRNLRLLGLDRYRRLAEPGQFLGDFVAFFSRCQDELVTPDDYVNGKVEGLAEKAMPRSAALLEDERKLREEEIARQREVACAYRASDNAAARDELRLTFGMQLLDAVRALDDDPALLAMAPVALSGYILVDENQDTNVAQIEPRWRPGLSIAATSWPWATWMCRRRPLPRRIVWKLHDFSRQLCRLCRAGKARPRSASCATSRITIVRPERSCG